MPKEALKEENIKRTLYKVYSVSAFDKAEDNHPLRRTSISPEGQYFAGCLSLHVPEVDLDVPVSAGQVDDPAHIQ